MLNIVAVTKKSSRHVQPALDQSKPLLFLHLKIPSVLITLQSMETENAPFLASLWETTSGEITTSFSKPISQTKSLISHLCSHDIC